MKNSIPTVFVLLLCIANLVAQEPFSENNAYGFKQNGKTIIPATFQYVTHFNEGLACVQQNGKWGYIDSTGKWIIEPQFISAQPMRNGSAKVKGENGVGVIDVLGNILVPLEFNFIEEWQGDYDLQKDGKKGLMKKGWKLIPPNYTQIENIGENLIYAQKTKTSYDVYTKNGAIFENQLKDIKYNPGTRDYVCVLRQNENYGVFSANKQDWIEQPTYAYIHFLPTSAYDCGIHDGSSYYSKAQFALVLCKELGDQYDGDYDFNYGIYNSLMDIKSLDGQVTFFSNINSYSLQLNESENLYNLYTYTVNRDSFIGILNSDMTIIDPMYLSITSFGNGEIRQLPTKFQYYNPDNMLEIEGDSIKTLRYYQDEFYDENGEFTNYMIHDVPSVLIIENDTISYIYNTDTHSIESPNFSSETNYSVEVQKNNYDGPMLFTIQYELNGLMGYKLVYEKDFSAMNYSQFYYVPEEGKTFTTIPSNGKEVILDYTHPNKVICSADEIFHSSKWNFEVEVYDDWGDFVTLENHYLFQSPFYILKENNKMGILTANNNVISPKYDTLYPYLSDSTFIITQIGELYGAINLMTGETVEPSYNEFPQIIPSSNNQTFYTYFSKKSGMKYFGSDNHWYLSNYTYFEAIDDSETEKWFVQMNAENAEVAVPLFTPIFDELQQTEFNNLFIASSNGKYGLINGFGDTLVPFEYTSIYESEYSVYNNQEEKIPTFTLYNKKKQGLYVHGKGTVLKAVYDYYYSWLGNNYVTNGWIAKIKNKYTLIDTLGNTILPAIYSSMDVYDGEATSDLIILHDKKNKAGLYYKDELVIAPSYPRLEPSIMNAPNILEPFVVEIYTKNKFGLYFQSTRATIPPVFDHIEYSANDDLLIKTKSLLVINEDYTGVYSILGEEIFPPIYQEVLLKSEGPNDLFPIVLGIKNEKIYARAFDVKSEKWMTKLNTELLFDQINGFDAVIFEKGKITKYDLKTGEMVNTVDSDDFTIQLNSGTITKENGKIGFTTSNSEIKIGPIFSSIEYKYSGDGVLFGVINGENYYLEPWSGTLVKEEEW